MPLLLIPHEVFQREATVWIGLTGEPSISTDRLTLRYGNGSAIRLGPWSRYVTRSGANTLDYQFVSIDTLAPATDYIVEAWNGDVLVATARLRTLPDAFEPPGGSPFNVLLASCFCSSRPGSESLGTAYMNLQRMIPTHLKILCGDQVYLDDPAARFIFKTHSYNELEDMLFANYVRTWSQLGWTLSDGYRGGYQQFLQNGANIFTSDDHEFWNNAPNRASFIRDTWSERGRRNWWQIASKLLGIFQSKVSSLEFRVGNASFLICDTRINRDEDRSMLLSAADLARLRTWVRNLEGVGILVVGQPIFSKKAGWFGAVTDWSFPDYEQYEEIIKILYSTQHSIVILTGDIHCGRIASVQLDDSKYIYEIISSPTCLVSSLAGLKWHAAPDRLPADSVPGAASREVSHYSELTLTTNHFLSLSFFSEAGATRIITNAVEIVGDGQGVVPVQVSNLLLR